MAKIGEVFCGTLINIGIGTKGTSDVEMWTNVITVQIAENLLSTLMSIYLSPALIVSILGASLKIR